MWDPLSRQKKTQCWLLLDTAFQESYRTFKLTSVLVKPKSIPHCSYINCSQEGKQRAEWETTYYGNNKSELVYNINRAHCFLLSSPFSAKGKKECYKLSWEKVFLPVYVWVSQRCLDDSFISSFSSSQSYLSILFWRKVVFFLTHALQPF